MPQTAGSLQLLHADALKYLEANLRDWRGWKLVSNLPYSVASPILVELALAEHGPERMVATLQLEVAKRLKAQANDEDYGLLTLLVQLNYEPRALFRISAGCFFPQPNVDSACLTLVRRPQPLLTPAQTKVFVRIVKQAFSQRRKMMAKLLRADWPEEQLARAMSELGLSPQIRAEAVTLKQFVELVRLMTEDIFDIVNERDEVIGRAPRREVHARGLLHRAVHVLVFNARGELFLQKRSKTKDREPGRWGAACSGHVDSGEDYDTAAVRELGEELGWRPGMPLERILRIEACRETDQEFVWVYRCSGEGPFALNAEEVETGGWFSPQQLEQWLAERPEEFTTAFVLLWRLLRGKN